MASAPAPVVSGVSQAELDQRQTQFEVTTALQKEAQAQAMRMQQDQIGLQRDAQNRQLIAAQRDAQIAGNASRDTTLLQRSTDIANKNDVSLMKAFQDDQSAVTENFANTNKEKQRKSIGNTDDLRSNFISKSMRTRNTYG